MKDYSPHNVSIFCELPRNYWIIIISTLKKLSNHFLQIIDSKACNKHELKLFGVCINTTCLYNKLYQSCSVWLNSFRRVARVGLNDDKITLQNKARIQN